MATRMQQRRGTAAQWVSTNSGNGPILEIGEIGFESDTGKFKIGDGVNHWIDLDYFTTGSAEDVTNQINAAIANLVDGAPGVLDTLNELAAAINDDPSFFTTVATNLSNHESDSTNVHGIANTAELATKAFAAELLTNATKSNITITGDKNGLTITAENGVADSTTDNLTEGTTNKYFTDQRALDATSAAYDPAGSAATAQSNAEDYADGLAVNYDAAGTASSAVSSHNSSTTNVHGILDTADLATQQYVQDAVSNAEVDQSTLAGIGIDWSGTQFDIDSTVTTNSGSQTLTNKTISAVNNTITIAPTDLTGVTAEASEINILDGATLSTTELNYVDGVTSSIQDQLDDKAPLDSPTLTGTPTAPTAAAGTNNIQVATTAYVDTAVSNLVDGAPAALNTLNELAAALGDDENFATTTATAIGNKVAKAGDTMTGALTLSGAPTNDLHAATKKYVDDAKAAAQSAAESTAAGALTSHENDTTNIHGISNTANLVYTNDSRLSDTRTPTDNTVSENKLVNSAVTTDKINDGAVTSAKIQNGTIVNEDINASAAIALSKLATDPLARANHTGTQTAATISDFDTQVQTNRLDQMAAPTASVSLNSQKITNLAEPTADQDAATKAYVDAATSGLNVHDAVRAATTGNVNLNNALENGDTLDGVTLATNDRVLVKNQNTASENGIYIVQNNGAAVRAADYNSVGEVDAGDFVFVQAGTINAKTGWVQVNTITTLGSDPIAFTQFSGAGTYSAGNGLTLSGTEFSINPATTADLNTAQTLTNKTVNLASNTLSGTVAEFNAALSNGDFATLAGTETLTGKSISGSSNTLTNIPNSALTNSSITINGSAVSLGGSKTLGTDDVTEGSTNKYFTDERAQDAVGNFVGTGLSYNDSTGAISVDTTAIQARVSGVSDTEIGYLDGVTSAIQTQLDAKAPTANPTFTGTVSGITKSMVGLGNVDNTSDANKPISTATQSALDLKAPLASPTFTGTVTLPTGTVTSGMIADGTIVNDDISASAAISQSKVANLTTDLAAKANLSGATFTGAINGTDLTLSGNLTVNGTTTNINSTNLVVEDKNVVLGDTASPTNASADGGGITLKGTTDKTLNWINATSSWTSSENLDLASGKSLKINGTDVLTSTQVLGKSLPSGTVVGTTDAQNLTNKTLTSPVITTPTGITKSDVGLGNVDNTSDANKPVSTATQSALDLKAPLASPTFTGTVILPNSTVTNAMLAGSISNDKLTNSSITINGSAVSLGSSTTIDTLPSQLNNAGKYLTTDGTSASWATVSGGGTESIHSFAMIG